MNTPEQPFYHVEIPRYEADDEPIHYFAGHFEDESARPGLSRFDVIESFFHKLYGVDDAPDFVMSLIRTSDKNKIRFAREHLHESMADLHISTTGMKMDLVYIPPDEWKKINS